MSQLRSNFTAFSTINAPRTTVQGRPRKIHAAAEEALLELLDEDPLLIRDKLYDFLYYKFDIEVSTNIVKRVLKKLV